MNNELCYEQPTSDTVFSVLLVSAMGCVCSLVAVMAGMQPIVA
jgi:hypothetical protein